MRFFAHDGKSTHGPAGIEELLKLPGFDGDTLVCPVGSDDTADWKPALAYPPFKRALLDALAASPAPAAPVEPPKAPPAPLDLPKSSLPPMPAPPPMPPIAPMAAPTAVPMPVPAPFPLPVPAAFPPPAPMAAPKPEPPAAKTVACPRCAHANLEEARFCNSCGAHMDGGLEDLSPSAPVDLPKAPEPAPAPAPAPDPFAHLDPMLSFPAEPAPLPESPRRPLQPGKMGQLAALEEPAPAAPYSSPSPALAPEPAPSPAFVPVWKRPSVLAAFAGAAVVAAGLAYTMLNKTARRETVAELTPASPPMPPPAAMPQPAPQPAPAPAEALYTTPPAASSPAMPAPRSPRAKKISKPAGPLSSAAAAAKPKRPRKPRPARAAKPEAQAAGDQGGGETLIESRAPEPKPKAKGKRAAKAARAQAQQDGKDPLLEALLTDATQPPAGAAGGAAAETAEKAAVKPAPMIGQRPAAMPGQFSLPGLQRPVSASDRARAPQARAPRPPNEEVSPAPAAGRESAALAEPGKSPPPPGIEDEPAKSAEGDQLALVQVHEQFDFCAQLLAQGAYGDHYDTCLCKDARDAAPYRGRRGFYATAKKKEAGAGHLETTAKILSSKIDGGVAKVTARWKSGAGDKGREATQTWKLEDGLWCQAP
ncbi:MAG: hypothetical protein PHS14_13570 [Elusimicrobia bacterium]|nr:hypothetical protein [Elusimicrobiota bacterium]